eukprot:CAMPEP_0202444958 /NCGR_PEP_ID=MMETSP1360-20130828/3864_1 /ASSEMBLY_ACC=CAM_ASM_000848 /TAXON_ID=515479 /ORGANISM="Licmophora paradoxa, Strain CCMP2313" /LENGTH=153 /DNA_ID=CAMNT_0049061067 /DNA_START=82 /DNA_END=543 /DNA_ORIENTATION=-
MSFSALSNEKLSAMAATAIAGIATGCLTFVSFVDTRSFLYHVEKKDTDLIRRHFPIWWPNGRDLMAPLLLIGAVANVTAYLQTDRLNFVITAGLLVSVGLYTKFVLGEDIEALRQCDASGVGETAQSFCNWHHPRLIMAATGFGLALVALAEL